MSDTLPAPAEPSTAPESDKTREAPKSVFLVPYPKVVFLYPTLVASIIAAIVMGFQGATLDTSHKAAVVTGVLFLGILGINLVILAFDFPRTTSLTLFFFAVAVVMGFILLFTFNKNILPALTAVLAPIRPFANGTFYWVFAAILGGIFVGVFIIVRFDYWEVRPNELLHHHGILANLERFSAPNLRIDKEINDVFEYMLLHSGRLILQPSNERRAIVLDNIPFIRQKEEAITKMLGALQVQVRRDTT